MNIYNFYHILFQNCDYFMYFARKYFNMKKIYTLIISLIAGFQIHAQFTTNLPVVIITTPGAIGDQQIQGTMSIIDNISGVNSYPNDPPTFTGMIGVKQRGNPSFAKKSYNIETWSAPNISVDTALLGMPSENDWVLIAEYPDRSLMRANLSFLLHKNMGRYAPRKKFVELVVNNQYVGIYNFGETIKRGSGRLDLSKLSVNDNFGLNMTGGYICKIDSGFVNGWQSSYAPPFGIAQTIKFQYVYPKSSDITPAQKSYIKSYVDSFENEMNGPNFQDTLLGWNKHGANNSFIDYIIIQELTKNYEAYRINSYLYKDKGTKLRPGPLWGGDLTFSNTANCACSTDTGWAYNIGAVCPGEAYLPPFWWKKITTDTRFMTELKCRYRDFREPGNTLDTTRIFFYIDSMKNTLNAQGAIGRNFTQWPIWGVPIVNEPTPMAADYNAEITNLKTYIKKRLAWLDLQWPRPASCFPSTVIDKDLDQMITVYPIPVNDRLSIDIQNSDFSAYQISLYNIQGVQLIETKTNQEHNVIDVSKLAKGIYFVQVKSTKGMMVRKVIIE